MLTFFVVIARRGPIDQDRETELAGRLEPRLSLAGRITHRMKRVSRSGNIGLFVFSNEPRFAVWQHENGRMAAASGYTTHGAELCALAPDQRLGEAILAMSGRFSAVVFDPMADTVAAANSAVRVDPLFLGESDDYIIVGTQASALAGFLAGDLRYDLGGLFTLINTGFFGTNETAFEGVSCLPSASTWSASGQRARWSRRPLGALKSAALPTSADTVEHLAADLRAATAQMNNDHGRLQLGLTGGKDSRLLLAAALAAGLEVDCSTTYQGTWSAPDVYVAKLVAEKSGVSHRVADVVVRAPGAEDSIIIDYLRRTATSLKATDGAVYGFESVAMTSDFNPLGLITGLGGEILRGGYAERRGPLEREAVIQVGMAQFAQTAAFFRRDVADRYLAFLRSWVSEFPDDVEGLDLLDCMYAEFRCGRWIAASSRATSLFKWMPFLDNRLTATMLRIRAIDKQTSRLHRELLERLSPALAEIVLANKFWPGTTAKEQKATRARHPQAFSTAKPASGGDDWRRSFPPALVAHVLEYCLDEGRLELLAEVLDIDKTAAFLRSGRDRLKPNFKFVHGLYSACVLLSGDWLRAPGIGRRLVLEMG